MKKTQTPRKTHAAGIARVLKRLHYPLDVMLLCVRWYVAYSLSLRNLEEMMAERGIAVDHSTVHRWVIKMRAFYLVGSGAELEGCVVGGKAGVPPFEVLAKTAVDDSDSHLEKKAFTLRGPPN